VKRVGWIAGAVVLAALVLLRPITTLLRPPREGTRLVLWHSQRGEERAVLEDLLRDFNRSNEGKVYVEPLGVPDEAFKDKLLRNAPRGSGPDLFIRPHNELGEFAQNNVVASVGGKELDVLYTRKLIDGLSVGGIHYGLPLTFKGLFLFYNKHYANTAPVDFADLFAMRERLPDGVFPLAYDATNLFFHAPLLLASGSGIFGQDGRSFTLFESPGLESFRLPGQWRAQRILPPEPNYNEAIRLFESGSAVAIVNGPWYWPGGRLRAQEREWDVAPLPSFNGRPVGSFVTVEGVFLSSKSAHPAESLDAAAFLTGREGALARRHRLGQPAALLVDPYVDPLSADPLMRAITVSMSSSTRHPIIPAQEHALKFGLVTPNDPRMAGVWNPGKDLLAASLAGRDFDDALRAARASLALVDRPSQPPSDWRPWGALLAALLLGGATMLVLRLRRDIAGPEAARARLTGFDGKASLPYLLPGMIAVVVVVFVPLVVGAGMSLFEHRHGEFTFTGLRNFADILLPSLDEALRARSFYFALAVTVLWTLVNVVAHVTCGVVLALLLRPGWNRLRTVYRVIFILPWAIPNYITALMWKGMFNAQVGAVNVLLAPFGFQGFNWFDRFGTAFAANLVTNMWLGFPFMMVITLGALQSIPSEMEEAATLDGAGRWQRFRYVVYPFLRPALVPAAILGSVWTFNAFNIIYLVSGG